MMKNYLFILLACIIMSIPILGSAQSLDLTKSSSNTIEGLSVFPNPVTNSKLTISTRHNLQKTIEIYDVLGKRIIATSILGETLNVSKLSPGIYILKITENTQTATKKLIVK